MGLPQLFKLDETEREWMFDMHLRNTPRLRVATLAVGALAAASVPWMVPLTLVPIALCVVISVFFTAITDRTEQIAPIVASFFLAQLLIATSIVVNQRQFEADICLLVFPLLAAASGFPRRLTVMCSIYTGLLMVGAALWNVEGLLDDPPALLVPIALLVGAVLVTAGLTESSIENRTAAAIDSLTGMLNRAALRTRTEELAQQSSLTDDNIAVLVADLDHFKDVNDSRGHAIGDEVLRQAAYRMRTALRAFDLAYRLGGEEFVFLLPGADADQAMALADRLRAAVNAAPMEGLRVTVSVGVAVSAPGQAFDFASVFDAADRALYIAKHEGRDRVTVAPAEDLPQAA
ncbi:MAG: GGDEF domain-containing protein [Solirubrobacteraceae bacterium]|nr:GGDEF domain-containing protein [Solirubrobacteraceae bacterium]